MKLKKLLQVLNKLPKEYLDCEVIIQKDSEGNGYSPLKGADENCVYIPENTWSGSVVGTKDSSAEDNDVTEDEYQELLKRPRAIVLYPVD